MSASGSFRLSRRLRWAFQGALALGFILFPLVFSPPVPVRPDEAYRQWQRFLPYYGAAFNALAVVLAYLNTSVFAPKILRPYGLLPYLLCLLGYLVFMMAVSLGLRLGMHSGRHFSVAFLGQSLFPALFFLSISTAYTMLNEYHRQQQTEKERENERLKSELAFLRWQISPHFIFNGLNSIVALARLRSDQTEAVTLKLAELMRYMLYESDEARVTLDREVRYLSSYVELQRLRFGKRVAIEFAAQGIDGTRYIEPMLLIPFVENAFKHGVNHVSNPSVAVRLRLLDDWLRLDVRNKRTDAEAPDADPNSGIGLKNVQRRLSLLYPHLHTLTIQREPEWFAVGLTLQLR